ncbi:MAG: hypothetical protein JWN40_4389, partial [Phycisphaerales bacterium]|nr:hypothetical protein [Phycisphaerales bacterium]
GISSRARGLLRGAAALTATGLAPVSSIQQKPPSLAVRSGRTMAGDCSERRGEVSRGRRSRRSVEAVLKPQASNIKRMPMFTQQGANTAADAVDAEMVPIVSAAAADVDGESGRPPRDLASSDMKIRFDWKPPGFAGQSPFFACAVVGALVCAPAISAFWGLC